ncbi:MAG TPA: hypothetical protein VMO47_04605 [Rhodothermales bacterium]|nr:hypothetical protein [Rhodothermales bacterium]
MPLLYGFHIRPVLSQVAAPTSDTVATSSATIYLQGTLLGGNKYVLDGVHHSAGGSFGKLRDALVDVPEAYEIADVGSRIVTHGQIIWLLGTAIGASTFFVHGETWEVGLSIGGFVIAGIGGAIQMKGKNRINEAVWLYNEAMNDQSSRTQ